MHSEKPVLGSSRFWHWLSVLIPILLLAFYGIFLTHKISLVTADLGRHIKNGEMVLENAKVLTTSFYSYTHTDFPVPNHHWGSGVIFYGLWEFFGLAGVELFFIIVSLGALWLFFVVAKKRASIGVAALVSIPAVFLLAQRTEIRPEAISYFFAALFFFLLVRFRDQSDNPKFLRALYFLPLVEILWVNIHIYYILGPIVLGTFLVESFFRNRAISKKLFQILIFVFLATLVSPFGIYGVIEVFTIFNNYGYPLVENQSVWFLEAFSGSHIDLLLFKIVFALTVASFLVPLCQKRWRDVEISSVLFTLGFGAMAWLAVRNFALFGFFTIPALVSNLTGFVRGFSTEEKHYVNILAGFVLGVLVFVTFFGGLTKFFPYWREGGIGLEQNNSAAADFWKREGLRGPIFNDYDIGGYLIYHFFPQERPFVDNRPEAYPADFFQKTYIPMQQDAQIWQQAEEKYHFNAIMFSVHDGTPWGQQFLRDRVNDPLWAPVFLDSHIVIFLKRTEANTPLIKKFQLKLR